MPRKPSPVSYQVHTVNSVLPPGHQQPCQHRHKTIMACQPCLDKAQRTLTRDDRTTFAFVAKQGKELRRLNAAEIAAYQAEIYRRD